MSNDLGCSCHMKRSKHLAEGLLQNAYANVFVYMHANITNRTHVDPGVIISESNTKLVPS